MSPQRITRIVALCLLAISIATAVAVLLFTKTGQAILDDPQKLGEQIKSWVQANLILSLLLLLVLYIVLAMLALPVWWLQVLAGVSIGLVWGVIACQIASTIAAVISASFAHWLAADWMHRLESKMERLRRFDEGMGHNGFLVVMALRLTYIVPFSTSNYLMGLTRINKMDIALGTLLGGIPKMCFYVALGWKPALLKDWKFTAGMMMVNLVLLIPIILRYLWPKWFKKIGVE
jgi:uncharacterized membrane protein YdjX (TVP38/TMEM64 family)